MLPATQCRIGEEGYILNKNSAILSKMNQDLRKLWAEKTFELTNIGAGALIFGQAFAKKDFSLIIALMGILLIVSGYFLSYLFLKKRR
jgi:hypothetical protein